MPATETSYGCGDGSFGIPNAESGMVVESITHDYTQDSKSLKDRTGNTCGIAYYNEQIKISINGKIDGNPDYSLAAILTPGNDPQQSYLAGNDSGTILINNITIDFATEDYQSIKISATAYPGI